MASWLSRLRAQPRSTRQFIAVGVALVVTGVIALGWLLYLSPFATQEEERREEPGFFETLNQSFQDSTEFLQNNPFTGDDTDFIPSASSSSSSTDAATTTLEGEKKKPVESTPTSTASTSSSSISSSSSTSSDAASPASGSGESSTGTPEMVE